MLLHEATYKAIKDIGTSCLVGSLPNVVADYSGYDDIPATKQILKEFVSMGYGTKVFELYTNKLPWQKKMQSFASEFANKTGFKEDLVNYVFECVEYGLGWLKTEPIYSQNNNQLQKKDYTEDLSGVDLDKQLILMQKEYISMLNSLIVVPDGKLYKKSGYYPAQAIAELWVVEHKIGIIGSALGKDYSSWCKSEKDKVLSQYYKSPSCQFGSVFAKVILPVIVIISIIIEGGRYVSSINELKEYNSYMAKGEEYMAKGNYSEAYEAFAAAGKEYDGVFANASKKKEATEKLTYAITPLFKSTIATSKELVSTGRYAAAKEALNELEQYPFDSEMRNTLSNEQKYLENSIEKAISDGKNTLLTIISTKGRKLDAKTRELLDELLKVAPDDYWLNFVYNKSK